MLLLKQTTNDPPWICLDDLDAPGLMYQKQMAAVGVEGILSFHWLSGSHLQFIRN